MDMKGIPYCRRASTAMVLLVMITSIFAGITIAGDDPGIRVMRAFDLDGDGLDDRSTTDMEFPVWTFVHFDPHFSEDVLSSLVSSGAGIHASYTMVPVISARFHDMGEIEAFLDLEEDAGIEIQGSISLLQDVSVKAVKASRSTEYSPTTAQDLGMNGAGITIAIIDTGVDNEHSTFEGAFVAGADLSVPASPLTPRDGTYDPDDRTGHGTAVASIALGRGDTEGNMKGVASQAGLIDLKVVGNLPVSLNQNSLMDSLQWCSDNLDTDWRDGYSGVDVVSISLGIGDGSSAVALAMDDLVSSGVVVVQGSGNSGSSYSSGAGTTWSDLSIVVGGIDDRDTVDRTDDEYWSTSTTGPRTDDGDDDPYDELRPDVVAPAVGITFASSSRTSFIQPASGWSEGSGTSYATPHMSGVAALMLQARSSIVPSGTQNPVRRIVHQTSESAGDPYDSSLSENYNVRYGFGMLDAYSAVRGAMAYTGVNHRPEIVYFEVKPNETTAGSTCRVRALAVDPDEETLDYTLTIDDGEIAGKAPLWDWTAPGEPGKYYFNLEVSDPSGGTVTAKTSVLVKEGSPNRPPVITSFRSQEDTLTIGGSTSLTVVAILIDGN
ncbi:MAG: S8 family serine peptidase, partial [Candidatus Thermoplasmatota archaeon]|nr:S8 family serine peptidase [Candidatus Thermoplasmatota archaeon]